MHTVIQYAYYVPEAMLNTEDTVVNKAHGKCPQENAVSREAAGGWTGNY